MKCPRDGSVLETRIYEADIEVDACPSCEGMWLDSGELEKIEEVEEHDYSQELRRIPDYIGKAYEMARQKTAPDIGCPKCGSEMASREYAYCSQVIIDVCPKCTGIWLDKGEIQALETFFERSRMEARGIRKGFWKSLVGLFKE
ncbi:MAG: TFIIB-type zinc ribbon-containing protein [Planctomycetota bacterium]|jgi:Zn-finger nucleic acid-binding protein